MPILNGFEEKRLNELYEKAVARYLDKTDFSPCDWLCDEESNELLDLMNKEQGE